MDMTQRVLIGCIIGFVLRCMLSFTFIDKLAMKVKNRLSLPLIHFASAIIYGLCILIAVSV